MASSRRRVYLYQYNSPKYLNFNNMFAVGPIAYIIVSLKHRCFDSDML